MKERKFLNAFCKPKQVFVSSPICFVASQGYFGTNVNIKFVGVGVVANLISNFILLVSSLSFVPSELNTSIARSIFKFVQESENCGLGLWVGVFISNLSLFVSSICDSWDFFYTKVTWGGIAPIVYENEHLGFGL